MPPPWETTNRQTDQSPRFAWTKTVVGSPQTNEEATVASLTITEDLAVAVGVEVFAWVAFTVGTSGVSANLKIHQTNSSGTTVVASGATTVAATNLKALDAMGLDAAPVLPGQVYIATLTIGSGAAASTVSAVYLRALVI